MIKLIVTILLILITLTGVIIFYNYQQVTQQMPIAVRVNETYENEIIEETRSEVIFLDVPLILQRPILPTGCEIVSATMMLAYNNIEISATELAIEIPYHNSDPSMGYVGNPFTTNGWTIYPEALNIAVKKYLPTAYVMNTTEISQIREQIFQEKPVVVWVSDMHGFIVHSVIITGYNQIGLFYNDPWSGEKNAWISDSDFLEIWADQDYRALSYL